MSLIEPSQNVGYFIEYKPTAGDQKFQMEVYEQDIEDYSQDDLSRGDYTAMVDFFYNKKYMLMVLERKTSDPDDDIELEKHLIVFRMSYTDY